MPAKAACLVRGRTAVLACALAPLGRLKGLGAAVIPLVVDVLLLPVALMLQCGLVLVEVPGRVRHVVGDMLRERKSAAASACMG